MTVRIPLGASLLLSAAVSIGCQPNQLMSRYNGRPYGPHVARRPRALRQPGDPFLNASAGRDAAGIERAGHHPVAWNQTQTVRSGGGEGKVVVAGGGPPAASPAGPFASASGWQPTQHHANNAPTITTPSF
ncbi:MAG: hypothetical protein ACE5KM_18135 [Planctomycetaceae bacterium]